MAGFHVDPTGGVRTTCSTSTHPRIVYAGQQGRIGTYLRVDREWPKSESSRLVRELVQLQVNANSGGVGGPVDVLALGGWIHVKPGSEE